MLDLESAIKHCEEVAEEKESICNVIENEGETWTDSGKTYYNICKRCVSEHKQLAEWLKELQWYRKQIQNLIDNKSFEIVNPYNTYEYARVVRVADLYDLMEVNADDE